MVFLVSLNIKRDSKRFIGASKHAKCNLSYISKQGVFRTKFPDLKRHWIIKPSSESNFYLAESFLRASALFGEIIFLIVKNCQNS